MTPTITSDSFGETLERIPALKNFCELT